MKRFTGETRGTCPSNCTWTSDVSPTLKDRHCTGSKSQPRPHPANRSKLHLQLTTQHSTRHHFINHPKLIRPCSKYFPPPSPPRGVFRAVFSLGFRALLLQVYCSGSLFDRLVHFNAVASQTSKDVPHVHSAASSTSYLLKRNALNDWQRNCEQSLSDPSMAVHRGLGLGLDRSWWI